MTIQIDRSIFLPQIKRFAQNKRQMFYDNKIALAEVALDISQQWMEEKPWKDRPKEYYDTQRECRIELKRYILNKLDMENNSYSWDEPSYIWKWMAKIMITYIAKLIIEHYWAELILEIGIVI